ncbi:unnamed protein product [Phaedon cochleariae]|uniref:SAM-dependent MTase RsmB/NOP-type domain-containing protein n=1 Tax=Phaedon cochleariae TaxID=80249 RepID=A0A9N9X535_PHACE|nr:unnamed protein product [Phaedon cochleariae]
MFKHSVKVPRLYKVAAVIAKEVSDGKGSIKQLVYEKQKKHPNIKALYALVSTLYQRQGEIDRLLKRSQFLEKEPRSDIWLSKILIVELLWGRKTLPGQSKPENTVRAYEQIFKAHLSDEKPTEIVISQGTFKPRYVRVNSLALTQNEAVEGFREEGWTLSKFLDKTNYKEFLNKIALLNEDEFMVDIHIPNLLIFPPKTEFYRHPAYKNGSLILQDKASCLPVHILAPPPGSKVLDMCAAPGMKTTHLAAAINDDGTVWAVERDKRRFETLDKIVLSSGAKCVKTVNKDVLTCNAEDFPGVEYVLVDPSCTGSGMSDRVEANQMAGDQNRLEKLTGFQIKILRSALTRYPDVKRVVYSTCSIYPEENEDVVRQVLETNYNFKLVPAQQYVGDVWQNFGSSEYGDIGKFCLYAKPEEDLTNGFFVAVFERLKEGEENLFFNTRIFNFKKHVQAKERRRNRKFDRGVNEDGEENVDVQEQGQLLEKKSEDESLVETDQTKIAETETAHEDAANGDQSRKKKKKKKFEEAPRISEEDICAEVEVEKKKKKQKKKEVETIVEEHIEPPLTKKRKSKSNEVAVEATEENTEMITADEVKAKKKSKHSKSENVETDLVVQVTPKKKKRHKDDC